jgi:beta-lactamase regulating signal transducer with metallopeptidase domain
MTGAALETMAQVVAERLMNTAGAGILLAALVYVLLRLIGRQNSGTRFALWFSALVAVSATPFLSFSALGSARLHAVSAPSLSGLIVLSPAWALYLCAIWIGCAALLLLRLGAGLARLAQLRRDCSEVDLASLDPAIGRIFQERILRRRVKLCVSSEVKVPAAIGFFRPAIVFPAWLLPELSAGEMEVIVRHELAHLGRWDDWTNLAQKIVKAVFFFHPAVWWIENRLTLEREMACDDMVLAQTGSPRAYASSLISFAEKLHSPRGLALAQALVSHMHQISQRVSQILDAKRAKGTGLWKPAMGLSTGVLALVVGAGPYMPRFVAFQAHAERNPTQIAREISSPQKAQRFTAASASAADMTSVAMSNTAARRDEGLEARAIPAAFHPQAAIARPLRAIKPAVPPKPQVLRADAVQTVPAAQETIVIVRAGQFGAYGPEVWTLCIWRVDGKQMASTWVVGSI